MPSSPRSCRSCSDYLADRQRRSDMADFTPGPWIFDGEAEQGFDVAISDGGVIATAWYCPDGEGREQALANAHLIAAAIDLLTACQAFLACPPRDRHDLHLEEIIALAVARATDPESNSGGK